MSMRCQICGKSRQFGHNVSFSQRKTNRDFKPNLQSKRVQVGSNKMTLKICTQCLRRLKAEENKQLKSSEAPKPTKVS